MSCGSGGADLGNDRKDDVLGGHPCREFAVDGDRHGPRLGLGECLCGENMLDFRGSDAEGQGAERAMGRCVGVATYDRCARLRDPLFWADHVDDALSYVADRQEWNVVAGRVLFERCDLDRGERVLDALIA